VSRRDAENAERGFAQSEGEKEKNDEGGVGRGQGTDDRGDEEGGGNEQCSMFNEQGIRKY